MYKVLHPVIPIDMKNPITAITIRIITSIQGHSLILGCHPMLAGMMSKLLKMATVTGIKIIKNRKKNLYMLTKIIPEVGTKELNLMGKDTGMAHSSTAKEASMLAIGNKTRCTGKVYFIILIKR
jgi:hypothetical protein